MVTCTPCGSFPLLGCSRSEHAGARLGAARIISLPGVETRNCADARIYAAHPIAGDDQVIDQGYIETGRYLL